MHGAECRENNCFDTLLFGYTTQNLSINKNKNRNFSGHHVIYSLQLLMVSCSLHYQYLLARSIGLALAIGYMVANLFGGILETATSNVNSTNIVYFSLSFVSWINALQYFYAYKKYRFTTYGKLSSASDYGCVYARDRSDKILIYS